MTAGFMYSPELTRNILREDHVLRPMRLRLVYELLQAYGVFDEAEAVVIEPRVATDQELMSFHQRDYVEAVQAFSRGDELDRQHRYGFGDSGDNPISEGMFEAAALAAGASIVGAEAVWHGRADVVFNAGGGYHHAGPDFASGFCVFNDAVIAILRLLALGAERVAYVDIDAHHGDGVQNAFYGSDRVLTVSVHQSGRTLFPGTGDCEETGDGAGVGYAVNLPLAPGTHDEAYAHVMEQGVAPLIRAFRPDVLVTQQGIDTHIDDPLTHLRLTSEGHTRAVALLGGLSPGRWLALGGGGYDLSAVARCWAMDYAVMAGADLPDEIPQSFRNAYGLTRLRDGSAPALLEADDARIWREAEESVRRVRQLVFPLHGLES